MQKGITLRLSGHSVADTSKALAMRLVEMGRGVEVLDENHTHRLGGADTAAYVCRLLSRNGVVVLADFAGKEPEGESIDVEIDEHDTPEFAAEKSLTVSPRKASSKWRAPTTRPRKKNKSGSALPTLAISNNACPYSRSLGEAPCV